MILKLIIIYLLKTINLISKFKHIKWKETWISLMIKMSRRKFLISSRIWALESIHHSILNSLLTKSTKWKMLLRNYFIWLRMVSFNLSSLIITPVRKRQSRYYSVQGISALRKHSQPESNTIQKNQWSCNKVKLWRANEWRPVR